MDRTSRVVQGGQWLKPQVNAVSRMKRIYSTLRRCFRQHLLEWHFGVSWELLDRNFGLIDNIPLEGAQQNLWKTYGFFANFLELGFGRCTDDAHNM